MYTFLPLMFFTGSYRTLNLKNFKAEVAIGLALDFFLYILPLFLLQLLNNATLVQKELSAGFEMDLSML